MLHVVNVSEIKTPNEPIRGLRIIFLIQFKLFKVEYLVLNIVIQTSRDSGQSLLCFDLQTVSILDRQDALHQRTRRSDPFWYVWLLVTYQSVSPRKPASPVRPLYMITLKYN